jgi:hypothetical protein
VCRLALTALMVYEALQAAPSPEVIIGAAMGFGATRAFEVWEEERRQVPTVDLREVSR